MGKKRYKTVIIDHDLMALRISKKYLEKDPRFDIVREFTDGQEALCFLSKEDDIDLILLELCIPTSGEKFMKELLQREIEADVIPITAARSGKRIAAALRLGAADYLLKPFTHKRFKECIDRYAERKSVAAGLKNVDQEAVDYLLHMRRLAVAESVGASGVEKRIMECFRQAPERSFTVKEIAAEIGASAVTARRYLKRLADAGRITSGIDYQTGGHPRTVYQLP